MSYEFSVVDTELRAEFGRLLTRQDVADLLEVSEKALIFHLYRTKKSLLYTPKEIRKKSGGVRTILAPNSQLKDIQRKLAYILNLVYKPKKCAHGYISNRSISSNAQLHVRSRMLLNIDISDFFPSINFGRVRGLFLSKPYLLGEEAATVLAQLCCFNNELPQGAPTSPVISNMICAKLDSDAMIFCRDKGCSYTRYVDDITFSSKYKNINLISEDRTIPHKIEVLVTTNGFKCNPKKTSFQPYSGRQCVTGLTVNEKVNIERHYIRSVRGMLHAIKKYGAEGARRTFLDKYTTRKYSEEGPDIFRVVWGRICFIKSIKGYSDPVFRKLYNEYMTIIGAESRKLPVTLLDKLVQSVIVIETKPTQRQGTAFLLKDIGWVTCNHVIKDEIVVEGYYSHAPAEKMRLNVVRQNEECDWAVLQGVGAIPLINDPLTVGDTASLKIGSPVTLCGFPNHNYSDSITYNKSVIIASRQIGNVKYYGINENVIYGNSGGPVLNETGEVIGIAARGANVNDIENGAFNGFFPVSYLNSSEV